MNKVLLILSALIITTGILAQVPERMSYQAVVRNNKNELIVNRQIGLRISIIQGDFNGPEVYREIFHPNPVTNANGLFTAEIGSGTPLLGAFSSIDWANGPYFIQSEIDTTGGTNYTITGTTQMLSVPYALHAKTAETFSGTITETDPAFIAWDKDYNDLTNKPDLSSFATEEMVNQTITNIDYTNIINTPDLSVYATIDMVNDNGTNDYNKLINKPDLSSYATKDMINESGNNDYNNLNNKPDLSIYATKDMVNKTGSNDYNDLAHRPDLSIYATKNMANQNITNLADPVNAQDAATKAYVDALLKRIERLEAENLPQQCQIYNSENSGLPYDYVTSIAIDAQGNKWFGFYNGTIAKFDNVNWTVYKSTETSISNDYTITSIAIDAQDNKWFGINNNHDGSAGGGLVKFDNTNWTIYNASNSDFPDYVGVKENKAGISKITIDSLDNKWIGTTGGGVAKFDGTNWTVYNSTNSDLPDNYISSIAIDALGNKWFSTSKAIEKFDDVNWTLYYYSRIPIPKINYGVSSIAIDEQGNKWFGLRGHWELGPGEEGGVAVFDDVNWSVYNSTNSGIMYSVFHIAIDSKGNKWFSMDSAVDWSSQGIIKFDGANWTVYNSTNSCLPSDDVRAIAIDADGNKWIRPGITVWLYSMKIQKSRGMA